MKAPTWFRLACAVALLASALLFAGCNPFGGEATPTPTPRVITPFVPPTPTPTPTATPTPAPVPTPTPVTKLTAAQVTQLVFLQVRTCAGQLAADGTKVELAATTVYSAQEKQWSVEVISKDGAITLGQYRVSDATDEVTSSDVIAVRVLQPDVTCAEPVARLTKGPVPPKILLPPTPTPAPVFGSKEEAQVGVWLAGYNCYGVFPEAESFIAYSYSAGRWVVEGKSTTTHYGLWEVDSSTGNITPLDQIAAQAAAKCSLPAPASFPAAVTGEQAELRVWIAVYDCIPSQPKRASFKVYVDNPQRWLVEGKEDITVEVEVERVVGGVTEKFKEMRTQTIYYGLWTVDATNVTIAPWDNIARATADKTCYRTP